MLDLRIRLFPISQEGEGSATSTPHYNAEIMGQLRSLGVIFEDDVGPWPNLCQGLPHGPISEIRRVISGLADLHRAAFRQNVDFYTGCLLSMLLDDTISGDAIVDKMAKQKQASNLKPGQWQTTRLTSSIYAACAYSVQALRLESNPVESWYYVCRACQMLGVAEGLYSCGPGREMAERGKKGGKKRHEKSALLKEWVIGKYNSGSWKSADQAAYALGPEVIEEALKLGATLSKFSLNRTVAKWIRESDSYKKSS